MSYKRQNHHYVPRFLLKGWAPQGWMYRYHMEGTEVLEYFKPTKPIGSCNDLYKIPDAAPEDAYVIEDRFMKPLDTMAADCHRRLLSGQCENLNSDERSVWTAFVMSLMVRTPHAIEHYKRGYASLVRRSSEKLLADIFENDEISDSYLKFSAMKNVPRMINNQRIGDYMINMKWSVLDLSSGSFLISDNAILGAYHIKALNGHVALPISSNKLFIMTNGDVFLNSVKGLKSRDLMKQVNGFVVRGARNFVGSIDQSHARFIKNNFGKEKNEDWAVKFSNVK